MLSNCVLLKPIQQQNLTCKVCEVSLPNVYAYRDNLREHAKRCDEYIGGGTCPKILPCCNSLELMRHKKWPPWHAWYITSRNAGMSILLRRDPRQKMIPKIRIRDM